MDRIQRLEELGQSIWLDYLDRKLLTSGELRRMIDALGVRGVTSNPTIFQKAIGSSTAYDDLIGSAPASEDASSVLDRIMIRDLRFACDELRPVYDRTNGADGFASIEVNPDLACETAAQIEEAQRLWAAVDRPNLMVKIPGTRPGLSAIQSCLAHGININVTLLFSVSRYREVIEAHLRGLEHRVASGRRIDHVASVASFFVSRVDAKVDKRLEEHPLRGHIAIANAKVANEAYERILASERWKALASKGARPQRILWASTSPKDPRYPDTLYADALVGPASIDTMTPETLRAFADHGSPEDRIGSELDVAHRELADLAALGIDLADVTEQLENEGVRSFSESRKKSLDAIREKRRRLAS